MGISKSAAWLLPILVLSCAGVGESAGNDSRNDERAPASPGTDDLALANDANDAEGIDDVMAPTDATAGDDADGLYLVMQVGKEHRLVLAPEASDDWAAGANVLEQRLGPTIVRRDVARANVPAALLAHEGELVRLSGAKGELCTARVGAPAITARVDASLSWERFSGEELDDDGKKLPPATDAEVAATAWGYASSGHALTASLTVVSGRCEGARYARAGNDANANVHIGPKAPSSDLRASALRAFRELPEFAAVQKRAEEESVKGPWDAGGEIQVRTIDVGGSTYLYVSTRVGEACGEFNGGLEAIYLVAPNAAQSLTPVLAFEGGEQNFVGLRKRADGSLDILYENTWTHRSGDDEPTVHTIEVPFIGCRC